MLICCICLCGCIIIIIIIFIIIYSFKSFSYQLTVAASQWSLSDSKSPQVSRTLLNLLADLHNAVVCMISTSLIFKSSSLFTNPLGIVQSAQTRSCITVTLMFHSFFVLWQGLSTCLSFRLLWFSHCSLPGRQDPLFGWFTFFFYSPNVWSSGRD